MRLKKSLNFILTTCLLACMLTLFGCLSDNGGVFGRQLPYFRSELNPQFNPTQLESKAAAALINPLILYPLQAGDEKISQVLLDRLNKQLLTVLNSKTNFAITNLQDSKLYEQSFNEVANKPLPLRTKAEKLCAQTGSSAVLYGVVTNYEEGVSSWFGSEEDARVGFQLWLVTKDYKEPIWNASFDARNQPLNRNLLRLPDAVKNGIGNKKIDVLVNAGFVEVADALEQIQNLKKQ
jgi:hypothetical protein